MVEYCIRNARTGWGKEEVKCKDVTGDKVLPNDSYFANSRL